MALECRGIALAALSLGATGNTQNVAVAPVAKKCESISYWAATGYAFTMVSAKTQLLQ